MVLYGQVVVGPPGSGKTTYCHGMQLFCQEIGRRAAIVNLDFANDQAALPYTPDVDVRDLVTLQEAMDTHNLGPNGGLMFCMEELERRVGWLEDQLRELENGAFYVIFDCPGQVELYSHHSSFQHILERLQSTGPIHIHTLTPPSIPIPTPITKSTASAAADTDLGGVSGGIDIDSSIIDGSSSSSSIGIGGSGSSSSGSGIGGSSMGGSSSSGSGGSSVRMGLGCRLCSVHLVDAFYCW
jgi:GTPase SAR1 family protein